MKRTQMLNAAYTLDSIINQAGTGSVLTHAANLTSFYELVPDATGDDWGWSLAVRPMEDIIGYGPPASLGLTREKGGAEPPAATRRTRRVNGARKRQAISLAKYLCGSRHFSNRFCEARGAFA